MQDDVFRSSADPSWIFLKGWLEQSQIADLAFFFPSIFHGNLTWVCPIFRRKSNGRAEDEMMKLFQLKFVRRNPRYVLGLETMEDESQSTDHDGTV
ncbi:Hypothetical protein NTJ_13511 [Nesidiocoris tenuis]|uniref:Uncharacterized protein n=1 Tax=Nesidiocoris tenuis TaxID=355587 RepID=A0ABN7BAP2_9HEMI|nr:Hypothetical protein NTJ_13511 [Nesidiocoris tenuis]